MLQFDIVTLFPAMFDSPLAESLMHRARERGLISVTVHNLRDFTADRHRTADDTPYGGGAGMVMKVEPIVAAVEALRTSGPARVVLTTPQGARFNQEAAQRLSAQRRLILICGRYEGVDERVLSVVDEEISLGDYILTGGEPAALVIVDAVARLVPGVVGDAASVLEDTLAGSLLKHPQYTRPPSFRGLDVPPVLLSGDHEKIRRWRRREALKRTLARRPDLLCSASLTDEDRKLLARMEKFETME